MTQTDLVPPAGRAAARGAGPHQPGGGGCGAAEAGQPGDSPLQAAGHGPVFAETADPRAFIAGRFGSVNFWSFMPVAGRQNPG